MFLISLGSQAAAAMIILEFLKWSCSRNKKLLDDHSMANEVCFCNQAIEVVLFHGVFFHLQKTEPAGCPGVPTRSQAHPGKTSRPGETSSSKSSGGKSLGTEQQ